MSINLVLISLIIAPQPMVEVELLDTIACLEVLCFKLIFSFGFLESKMEYSWLLLTKLSWIMPAICGVNGEEGRFWSETVGSNMLLSSSW